MADFYWPWSNPDSPGQLVDDVKLDGFSMPWNAMPDAGKLAPAISKSNFWASGPNGINQVGCVYMAQGFEFDYVGVKFGRDVVLRCWLARQPQDLTRLCCEESSRRGVR